MLKMRLKSKLLPRGQKHDEYLIDQKALSNINDSFLSVIKELSMDVIQRRLNEITVERVQKSSDIIEARKILDSEGIVVVRNFLRASQLSIAEECLKVLEAALAQSSNNHNFEDDRILVQSAHYKLNSYQALASYSKTVADVRRGADEGMIDTFNFDRLAGTSQQELRDPFSNNSILSLLSGDGMAVQPRNLNLYINRGVMKTRGFHVDRYKRKLKGFVYLSDVNRLEDGPYCYVRGSAQDGPWRWMNQAIAQMTFSSTEAPLIDLQSVVPVLSSKGSLVISDQAGIHRGLPQDSDGERAALVMAYY